MRTFLSRTALAAAAILLAAPALAQSTAPAAAPVVSIAPPACEKPGTFPGRVAEQARVIKWANGMRAYTDCLKAYVGERNAVIDANAKQAKSAVDEYNAAVKEFNEAMGNN